MPIPTHEQLRAALAVQPPRRVKDVCVALGTTLAGVRCKRADGSYQHPELVAILQEHATAGRQPRDASRKLGRHTLAIPGEILAGLDALVSSQRAAGVKRASRSAAARALLDAALRGPLPKPLPGERAAKVDLDLGPSWEAVGARLETDDPEQIAGAVRAILAAPPRR